MGQQDAGRNNKGRRAARAAPTREVAIAPFAQPVRRTIRFISASPCRPPPIGNSIDNRPRPNILGFFLQNHRQKVQQRTGGIALTHKSIGSCRQSLVVVLRVH